MPASPWRTFGTPDPNYDFVVLLSFLPLKSYWRVLPFFFYTAQVVWQLAGAGGLVGYSLLARPFKKQFWTLSAWRNEGALRAFVQHPPHVHVMTALAQVLHEFRTDEAGASDDDNLHAFSPLLPNAIVAVDVSGDCLCAPGKSLQSP